MPDMQHTPQQSAQSGKCLEGLHRRQSVTRLPAVRSICTDTCEGYQEHRLARKCTFCGTKVPAAASDDKHVEDPDKVLVVCDDKTCRHRARRACTEALACGHRCGGTKGHRSCPPCLHEHCVPSSDSSVPVRMRAHLQPIFGRCCVLASNKVDIRIIPSSVAATVPVQVRDDFCSICWTETYAEAPCIQVECGHVFHRHCLKVRDATPIAQPA